MTCLLHIIEYLYMAFSEIKTFLGLEEDSGCLNFLVLGCLEDIVDGLVIEIKIAELNSKNQY